MKFITRQQDRNLMPTILAALFAIVLLSVNVSGFLLNNAKWVVEPALVADRSGARMFSYNPRISILINRLQAGNVFDRKGRILATSQPGQVASQQDSLVASGLSKPELEMLSHKRLDRYYPFGEQMFFWTGDANTGVFNGSTNGYFAEYEHDAELRGFPTPVSTFQVSASRFRQDRFLPRTAREMIVSRRDYSALSPLLLAGINSPEVRAFKQKNRDVQLTLDAALQTSLQNAIALDDSLKTKRTSIVIMEDQTGNVLASAGYPLPPLNNWDLLTLSEPQLNKLPGWNVNSDLGFTVATQPGSTAKLVTTLAAFNKLGEKAANKIIVIRPGDLIRVKGLEPDEAGNISLERALVRSNNSFFIKLANEERLEEEMERFTCRPVCFCTALAAITTTNEPNNASQQNQWRELWRKTEFTSRRIYNPNNIRRTRGRGISGMAWGQGELVATPASVARLAAGIANHGNMMPNRYVLSISGKPTALATGIAISKQPHYAALIKGYMISQSINKVNRLGISVAGKTGTPERILKSEVINDGWYVFFAPKVNGPGHIVTCVRIEDAKGSSEAVKYAGLYVIPELLKRGYIKGFPVAGDKNRRFRKACKYCNKNQYRYHTISQLDFRMDVSRAMSCHKISFRSRF